MKIASRGTCAAPDSVHSITAVRSERRERESGEFGNCSGSNSNMAISGKSLPCTDSSVRFTVRPRKTVGNLSEIQSSSCPLSELMCCITRRVFFNWDGQGDETGAPDEGNGVGAQQPIGILLFLWKRVVRRSATNIKEAPTPVASHIYHLSLACCQALNALCRSSSPLKRHGTRIDLDPFFSS